jgi:prophage antirepressor-like protein
MITNFSFNNFDVRVVLIENEPWFVATDICAVLEHSDVSMACKRLKPYEKDTSIVCTLGGNQEMMIISESGLYRLVLTSRKPQAEPFQDWVCQQVLPQIRKTGKYSTQSDENPRIAPSTEARKIAFDIRDIRDAMGEEDPRLAQFLIDHAISGIMEQKQLAGVRYRGVVEIAEEMGFKVDHHNRSQLGKFVKSMLPEAAKQEERLVNGSFRKVCCYPDTEEVRAVISKYFN